MKRLYDCADFAKEHDIPLITVDEMVRYLKEKERKEMTVEEKLEEEFVVIENARSSRSTDES